MSKKTSAKSATKGRVCGVCIAGLVSGMASGGIALRKRAKAQGRSGGADAALYRASFDRPRGKGVAARFWLSPAGYDTLVKLEAEALTRAQIEDAMRRWKVGARVYRRATGEPVWNLSVKPSGDIVVDVDWERVRREQRESALRGPRAGRSSGQAVAEGILEQLGGQKFLAMTAATKLLSFSEPGHGGLQFKLPRRGARAKLGIDAVRITLELSDTYTMDFFKGMEKVRSIGSLYSDDLRRVFTEVTGLETSLGTMGRAAGKKDPKELVSWGVFPYTPDSSPSAGDPVPDTRRGYVAREVNRETGRGTHWPYSRVQAVKIYWRRHLADAYATELTYGRKKP